MEAMVVMDTMERERPKLSQDMVDMDIAADMDMEDTDAVTTVRGRLKPNPDTSPEVMDMAAMAVMDTMERGRPKPSQDMVDMDIAADMDMEDTDAVTTVRGRLKPNPDTSPEVMDTVAMEAMAAMA